MSRLKVPIPTVMGAVRFSQWMLAVATAVVWAEAAAHQFHGAITLTLGDAHDGVRGSTIAWAAPLVVLVLILGWAALLAACRARH